MSFEIHSCILLSIEIVLFLRFIPAQESPNGQPLLIVAGAVSGTLTLLKVNGLHHTGN